MDCPKHPIRKRRDTCEVCAAPYPKPNEVRAQASPRFTEDGLTWLDRDGNPPKLDSVGRLAEPFVFIPNAAHYCYERWGAGLTLPMTPVALKAFYAEEEARRARIHKRKEVA